MEVCLSLAREETSNIHSSKKTWREVFPTQRNVTLNPKLNVTKMRYKVTNFSLTERTKNNKERQNKTTAIGCMTFGRTDSQWATLVEQSCVWLVSGWVAIWPKLE